MSTEIKFPANIQSELIRANAASGVKSIEKAEGASFKGLDIDKLGLSDEAKGKIRFIQSQFEVNYQVLRSVNSKFGFQTSEENFSFAASREFLQRASGQSENKEPSDETNEAESAEETNVIEELEDYFSAENTANRILDVATSFFELSSFNQASGNSEQSRQQFSDFIGAAIQEGFRQAKEVLGDLPEEISGKIQETNQLVFSGLEDFVKNGIDEDKAKPGGVFEKIATYRKEGSEKSKITKTSSTSYNSKGEPV
jgi:hypothetical protein